MLKSRIFSLMASRWEQKLQLLLNLEQHCANTCFIPLNYNV